MDEFDYILGTVDPNHVPAGKGPRNHLRRLTCSQRTRELVLARYPSLRMDEGHRHLMQYLLFAARYSRDEFERETGRIIVGAREIAECYGKLEQNEHNNFHAEEHLERFRSEVLPEFEWTDWSYKNNRAREVQHLGIDEDILEAIKRDLETPADELDERVYFDTGERYGEKRARAQRHDAQRTAQGVPRDHLPEHLPEEAVVVLEYMNTLAPHRFTKAIRERMPEARRVAEELEDPEKREAAFRTLRAIEDQAQPFYQPSRKGHTVRLFGLMDSLLNLKKEVRQVLTQDWAEFDLRSSQLAICASLWGVEEALSSLKEGGDFWVSLRKHLGLGEAADEEWERARGALKSALYSLLYGKGKKKLTGFLEEELGEDVPNVASRFFAHPVIRAMYKQRSRVFSDVKRDGGARDCFGRWISLEDREPQAILADQAQALEMKLLLPVFELAESSKGEFSVVLWQHDGFCVAFKNASKAERWAERIERAVNEEAERHGVPTVLERKR